MARFLASNRIAVFLDRQRIDVLRGLLPNAVVADSPHQQPHKPLVYLSWADDDALRRC